MSIKVGSIKSGSDPQIYNYQKLYPDYEIVVVMTKSSKWGSLGPYVLRNENGILIENLWQFSKIYEYVPKSVQRYSQYDQKIIWDHPEETHIKDGKLTTECINWIKKGFKCQYAIRYPVGYSPKYRAACKFAIQDLPKIIQKCTDYSFKIDDFKQLDYIEARKLIYLPEYCKSVKKQSDFTKLKDILQIKNLLILEVDGPVEKSLSYYTEKYNVNKTFIVNGTIDITKENLKIMLNDTKHPFGHGYCLAAALLDLDNEIL